jgi:hypothetical protein
VEERDLASSTANKKKKTPAPTSMIPTPAPTSLEEEESSSSSTSPSPTPKPHKKDKEKEKHTKVTKETVSPTTMGSGDADAANTTSTVVSEEEEEANVTPTVTTPSPTPKPHKKKKDTKKPHKVVSSSSPTSSLEAAEEELIEDEIDLLETEAYIIDTLLGNITNGTDVFWNDTNAMNTTTTEYDSYGNSNTPTEVSSTESKAATLQDEIIKNINEEEEEAEEQEEEEKQAVNITTNSPTSAPILSVASVKPNKGVNGTMDKQNETEVSTTTTEEPPIDNFTTTTTTTTTPYDDFVEYYEEIIEDYEGSSSTPTNYTSTTTKTSTGEYYSYYDYTAKSQTTAAVPTEEEEYDLTKVTRPTSPLDVTTTTTTSTSKKDQTVGDQTHYYSSTNPTSSSSSAAASFTEANQQQISPAKMKWMTFGMVIAMLFCMIYTAYQVSDNPDGIYASCCRLSVAVVIYVIRGILTPCRAICCRYTLISNSTPDYREPYRGRRGHMELT